MQNPYQATEEEIELGEFWAQRWQQRWVPPTNDGEFCDDDTPGSYSSYSDGGDVTPNIAPFGGGCRIAPFGGGCRIAPFGGCYQDLHLHLQHEGEEPSDEEPSDEEPSDEETNDEEPNDEEPNDEEIGDEEIGDEGEMEIPECTDVPHVPETRETRETRETISAKSVSAKKTKPKPKSKSAAIVPKPKFIPFQITINVNHENDPVVVLFNGKKDTDLPSKHHSSHEAKNRHTEKWTHTNRAQKHSNARGTRIAALE